jgi:hypothetical protein
MSQIFWFQFRMEGKIYKIQKKIIGGEKLTEKKLSEMLV